MANPEAAAVVATPVRCAVTVVCTQWRLIERGAAVYAAAAARTRFWFSSEDTMPSAMQGAAPGTFAEVSSG